MRMDFNPKLGQKRPREAIAVTFNKEDIAGVIFPHNDALVISLKIGVATIKRIMVDQVTAGLVTVEVDFLVIDLPSTYNAILGRIWLHLLEAVPSSYHQMLKFPYEDKVVEITGDQAATKECFMEKV
ncbi:uncharacterized protein LOC119996936 [Tripterygium wilfordii]|uniref:uncharacterized protein LOC119996936 n=1 Tax=Tripterygium wilfordii TaxID=458696 RepID=UPI0018F85D6C|nr:uncharacterized protein LOC119996936 [Tripterygium wilfordii]